MDRDKVDARPDIMRVQFIDELRAINRESLDHQLDDIQMPCMFTVGMHQRRFDFNISKKPESTCRHTPSCFDETVELFELMNSQRRLEICHIVLVSRLLDLVVPAAGAAVPLPRITIHSMQTQQTHTVGEFPIGCHYHSTSPVVRFLIA